MQTTAAAAHKPEMTHIELAGAAFRSELQTGFLEGRLCQKTALSCVHILASKIHKIKKMQLNEEELHLALRAVLKQARSEAASRKDEMLLAAEELPNHAREISHRASRLLEAGRFRI